MLSIAEHLPTVGMVWTYSPSFNLYNMVVFPAESRPIIRSRTGFFPLNNLVNFFPILPVITLWKGVGDRVAGTGE